VAQNLTRKILAAHMVGGSMTQGSEILLRIDQTMTQDATGTMAYLQFEATGTGRVRTDLSVSYVDHNTLQMNFRNPDDHVYLRTVAAKHGIIFSPPGTGICHQLHLENFAKPGATLIGSDSHTPTAGGMGSLAFGAGGLSVALAMAGEPYAIAMPEVVAVRLVGRLKGWATAKDIILHLLKLLTVKGGVGKVFEFAGPGVAALSVPDRATITNMGAELGATTSIFPSDGVTGAFLERMGRSRDWKPLAADEGATYDGELEIRLDDLLPLAAQPHMPDLVVPVADLAGLKAEQVAIGSCTNSSYSDLHQVAQIFSGKRLNPATDTLISPGSTQVLRMLMAEGMLDGILDAGARLLECACGPCIGAGGAPPSNSVSVRTFNRNFHGRSGTDDAKVYLVSPLVAAQVALAGRFTDPAAWGEPPLVPELPDKVPSIRHLFIQPPANPDEVEVVRGPNIVPLQPFDPMPGDFSATVLINLGDNISTDHIMPASAQITSLRSNIPAISAHVLGRVDAGFAERARQTPAGVIVAGENYGQGSSREHAALAPRYLGVRALVAVSFARIHRANLVNFGILPLILVNPKDKDLLEQGLAVRLNTAELTAGGRADISLEGIGKIPIYNDLTQTELDSIMAGGLLNYVRLRRADS
jgi:aconitate hydratase